MNNTTQLQRQYGYTYTKTQCNCKETYKSTVQRDKSQKDTCTHYTYNHTHNNGYIKLIMI